MQRLRYMNQIDIKGMIQKYCFVIMICALSVSLHAQYKTINLNSDNIAISLSQAPSELAVSQGFQRLELSLPYDGITKHEFYVFENETIHPDLASKFPNIKSYSVQSVHNPETIGAVTVSPEGYYANYIVNNVMIGIRPNKEILGQHTVQIGTDPNALNDFDHNHEYRLDGFNSKFKSFKEKLENINEESEITNPMRTGNSLVDAGGEVIKRKYDFLASATGEFTTANGGVAGAQAVIIQTVNCINAIFNKDVAICLVVVDNTSCVFPNAGTDPYDPAAGNLVVQAADEIANCATVGYDIGHVFHTTTGGGSGIAAVGVVCIDGTCNFGGGNMSTGACKAAGWSGNQENLSNDWCQLIAHEVGHQFGASHTFNGSGMACDLTQISTTNAVEIGSGSTLMSYNGICDPAQNIPSSGAADAYLHTTSIDQIQSYLQSLTNPNPALDQSCHVSCPTGNTPPVSDADPCSAGTISIPIGTPFKLNGSATDANGDGLTYTWEQIDEDGAGTPTQGATLNNSSLINGLTAGNDPLAPLYRSYPPSSSACRYFPALDDYKTNVNTLGTEFEVLSQVPRTLNFTLTARDCNASGGGTSCDLRSINVVNNGPLTVNSPCTGGDLMAGSNATLTWNTNGSNALCSNVEILMSTDGGCTFPFTLVSNVSYNGGTSTFNIPSGTSATTEARFIVQCQDNPCATFFAMTDSDCTIISDCIAAETILCPNDDVTAVACSSNANLTVSEIFIDETITSFASATGGSQTIIINNAAGTACEVTPFASPFASLSFITDASGTYSFNIDFTNFTFITIFSGSTFNCANFIASSGTNDGGGFIGGSSPLNASLDACTEYTLIAWQTGGAPINISSISGPGNVQTTTTGPTPNYEYTYLAVNQSNGQVEAVSPTSDFSTLGVGCYDIYGANYENDGADATSPPDVDPSLFVGQTFSAILGGGNCVVFSNNSFELCLTAGNIISNVMVMGTPTCSGADAQYTICFDAAGGSGDYDLVDGTNTASVITSIVGQTTNGNVCFTNVTVANNSSAQTISVNVVDNANPTCAIGTAVSVNLPACSSCPDLSSAPTNVTIINSACNGPNCMVTGGSITAPTGTPCPSGSTIEYAVNGGSFTAALPTYLTTGPAQSIVTRCVCTSNTATISPSSVPVVTVPGACSMPTAEAGTLANICDDASAIAISGSPIPGAGETGTWTGMGITDASTSDEMASFNPSGLSGSISLTYTFVDANGCSDSDMVNITVIEAPDAGTNGTLTICEGTTLTTALLFAELGGTPDNTGTWTPALAGAGTYIYTVTGTAPCTNATAQVVVSVQDAPDAGSNGTLTICEGTTLTATLLFEELGGTPDNTGTWIPALAGAGTYTYTVTGTAPCTDATAQVVVSVQDEPDAGSNGTLTICEGTTLTTALLFAELGGTPDNTGTWTPALAGAGTYTYTVTGIAPCTDATAQVVVSVQDEPNAGSNGTLTICEGTTLTTALLFAELGGTPDNTGTWTPALAGAGTYTYTVTGTAPCTDATAQVVVSVQVEPDAGSNGTLTICEGTTLTTALLFAELGGTPDNTGTWTPTLAGAGTYTYTVTGTAPCTDATAQVVASVQDEPDAGTNGTLTICEGTTLTTALLFAELGGTPDNTGTWTPALTGAGTYTYTVTGTAPCTDATAQVVVSVQDEPDAGTNGTLTICEGTTLTTALLFAELGGTPDNTGTWTPALASAGTYTYTVTGTPPCTDATAQVVVSYFTETTATADALDTSVCLGSDINLTETGGDGIDWSWTGPNAYASSDQNPSISMAAFTDAGNYIVEVTDVNGCTNSSSVMISVLNTPPVAADAISSMVCEGETIMLTETAGGDINSWQWTGPNGYSSSAQNPIINTAALTNDGSYFVEVTDVNGCTNSAETVIVINPTPATPNGISFTDSQCQADGVTVNGGSFSGFGTACITGTLTFYTDPAGTMGATTTAPTYNQNGPSQILYTRCVDSANNCESSVSTVGPTNPGSCTCPDLTQTAPLATIIDSECNNPCVVNGGSISAPLSGCPVGSSLEYSLNNTTWSAVLPVYDQTNALTIYTRCICGIDTDQVSPSGSIMTTPGSCTNPVAAAASSTLEVCLGQPISLMETGGDAITWMWTGPNSYTSTAQNPTITNASLLNDGSYMVVVTDGNGCTEMASVSITVNDLPVANAMASESTICSGENIVLSENGGDAVSWHWSGPNSFSDSNQNVTINNATALNAGLYTVVVTSNDNCTNSSTVNITVNDTPNTPNSIGITDSQCQADGVTVSGGSFDDIASACTTGTLTFYSDPAGTMNATTMVPVYNQTGPSQTLYVRCVDTFNNCESDVESFGPTSPGVCMCPDLSSAAPSATVTESECSSGCTLAGGSISAPTSDCPDGSSLEYSTDNVNWSNAIPAYDQSTSIDIFTRCVCTLEPSTVSSSSQITTVPGTCAMPTASASAVNMEICEDEDIELQETGGDAVSWTWSGPNAFSSTDQNPMISNATSMAEGSYIVTILDNNGCSDMASIDITVNANPTTPSGISIVNSLCQADGITVSGGSFEGTSTACASGVLTVYTDAAATMGASTIIPVYNQTGPAQVLYLRCVDMTTNCQSDVLTVGPTVPGACTCPDLSSTPNSVIIVDNDCSVGCMATGGSISAPVANTCPVGSSMEYSTDNSNWSNAIPSYQPTSITVYNRCACNLDDSIVSPTNSATTAPCVLPAVPDPVLNIIDNSCPQTTGTISVISFVGTINYYTGPDLSTAIDNATNNVGGTIVPPSYQEFPTNVYLCIVDELSNGCVSNIVCGETNPTDCNPPFEVNPNLAGFDPCDCLDDQSANGAGDGTFSEVVSIVSTPLTTGLSICVADGATPSSLVGSSFTDNNDGTYSLMFNHTDGIGYNFQVAECSDLSTPLIADVFSNVCHYPIIGSTLPTIICDTENDINLETVISEISGDGDFMGSFTYSGAYLPGGATFSPVDNGVGSYTISIEYTPTVVVGDNPGADANCPTEMMIQIDVITCQPCESDNGTISIKSVGN